MGQAQDGQDGQEVRDNCNTEKTDSHLHASDTAQSSTRDLDEATNNEPTTDQSNDPIDTASPPPQEVRDTCEMETVNVSISSTSANEQRDAPYLSTRQLCEMNKDHSDEPSPLTIQPREDDSSCKSQTDTDLFHNLTDKEPLSDSLSAIPADAPQLKSKTSTALNLSQIMQSSLEHDHDSATDSLSISSTDSPQIETDSSLSSFFTRQQPSHTSKEVSDPPPESVVSLASTTNDPHDAASVSLASLTTVKAGNQWSPYLNTQMSRQLHKVSNYKPLPAPCTPPAQYDDQHDDLSLNADLPSTALDGSPATNTSKPSSPILSDTATNNPIIANPSISKTAQNKEQDTERKAKETQEKAPLPLVKAASDSRLTSRYTKMRRHLDRLHYSHRIARRKVQTKTECPSHQHQVTLGNKDVQDDSHNTEGKINKGVVPVTATAPSLSPENKNDSSSNKNEDREQYYTVHDNVQHSSSGESFLSHPNTEKEAISDIDKFIYPFDEDFHIIEKPDDCGSEVLSDIVSEMSFRSDLHSFFSLPKVSASSYPFSKARKEGDFVVSKCTLSREEPLHEEVTTTTTPDLDATFNEVVKLKSHLSKFDNLATNFTGNLSHGQMKQHNSKVKSEELQGQQGTILGQSAKTQNQAGQLQQHPEKVQMSHEIESSSLAKQKECLSKGKARKPERQYSAAARRALRILRSRRRVSVETDKCEKPGKVETIGAVNAPHEQSDMDNGLGEAASLDKSEEQKSNDKEDCLHELLLSQSQPFADDNSLVLPKQNSLEDLQVFQRLSFESIPLPPPSGDDDDGVFSIVLLDNKMEDKHQEKKDTRVTWWDDPVNSHRAEYAPRKKEPTLLVSEPDLSLSDSYDLPDSYEWFEEGLFAKIDNSCKFWGP